MSLVQALCKPKLRKPFKNLGVILKTFIAVAQSLLEVGIFWQKVSNQ